MVEGADLENERELNEFWSVSNRSKVANCKVENTHIFVDKSVGERGVRE